MSNYNATPIRVLSLPRPNVGKPSACGSGETPFSPQVQLKEDGRFSTNMYVRSILRPREAKSIPDTHSEPHVIKKTKTYKTIETDTSTQNDLVFLWRPQKDFGQVLQGQLTDAGTRVSWIGYIGQTQNIFEDYLQARAIGCNLTIQSDTRSLNTAQLNGAFNSTVLFRSFNRDDPDIVFNENQEKSASNEIAKPLHLTMIPTGAQDYEKETETSFTDDDDIKVFDLTGDPDHFFNGSADVTVFDSYVAGSDKDTPEAFNGYHVTANMVFTTSGSDARLLGQVRGYSLNKDGSLSPGSPVNVPTSIATTGSPRLSMSFSCYVPKGTVPYEGLEIRVLTNGGAGTALTAVEGQVTVRTFNANKGGREIVVVGDKISDQVTIRLEGNNAFEAIPKPNLAKNLMARSIIHMDLAEYSRALNFLHLGNDVDIRVGDQRISDNEVVLLSDVKTIKRSLASGSFWGGLKSLYGGFKRALPAMKPVLKVLPDVISQAGYSVHPLLGTALRLASGSDKKHVASGSSKTERLCHHTKSSVVSAVMQYCINLGIIRPDSTEAARKEITRLVWSSECLVCNSRPLVASGAGVHWFTKQRMLGMTSGFWPRALFKRKEKQLIDSALSEGKISEQDAKRFKNGDWSKRPPDEKALVASGSSDSDVVAFHLRKKLEGTLSIDFDDTDKKRHPVYSEPYYNNYCSMSIDARSLPYNCTLALQVSESSNFIPDIFHIKIEKLGTTVWFTHSKGKTPKNVAEYSFCHETLWLYWPNRTTSGVNPNKKFFNLFRVFDSKFELSHRYGPIKSTTTRKNKMLASGSSNPEDVKKILASKMGRITSTDLSGFSPAQMAQMVNSLLSRASTDARQAFFNLKERSLQSSQVRKGRLPANYVRDEFRNITKLRFRKPEGCHGLVPAVAVRTEGETQVPSLELIYVSDKMIGMKSYYDIGKNIFVDAAYETDDIKIFSNMIEGLISPREQKCYVSFVPENPSYDGGSYNSQSFGVAIALALSGIVTNCPVSGILGDVPGSTVQPSDLAIKFIWPDSHSRPLFVASNEVLAVETPEGNKTIPTASQVVLTGKFPSVTQTGGRIVSYSTIAGLIKVLQVYNDLFVLARSDVEVKYGSIDEITEVIESKAANMGNKAHYLNSMQQIKTKYLNNPNKPTTEITKQKAMQKLTNLLASMGSQKQAKASRSPAPPKAKFSAMLSAYKSLDRKSLNSNQKATLAKLENSWDGKSVLTDTRQLNRLSQVVAGAMKKRGKKKAVTQVVESEPEVELRDEVEFDPSLLESDDEDVI